MAIVFHKKDSTIIGLNSINWQCVVVVKVGIVGICFVAAAIMETSVQLLRRLNLSHLHGIIC